MPARDWRRSIASTLMKLPTSCPADVLEWAETGLTCTEDDLGRIAKSANPDTSSGVRCPLEAAVHHQGCCYCGKFRTGLEVCRGEA